MNCRRAPTLKIELTTLGKGKLIGQVEVYPDSATDCSLVGISHVKAIGMKYTKSKPG